jgi:hypothetical protein
MAVLPHLIEVNPRLVAQWDVPPEAAENFHRGPFRAEADLTFG